MADPAVVEQLRARIGAMERSTQHPAEVMPLGAEGIDRALPWGGLPLACLHQVMGGGEDDGAATAFCAMVLGRLARRRRGTVLWCARAGAPADTLHGPGLAGFGLEPERLILARGRDETEVLWAMEEGLRCPALCAVAGETRRLDPTAGRRLKLAAETGGVTGLLLHPALPAATQAHPRRGTVPPGVATTRWRVRAMPSPPAAWDGLGPPRWRVELERCRGGTPRTWSVEWNERTASLAVVADMGEDMGND